MALNFPTNPTDGQTYEGYVYDATAGVWNSDPHQIASRFVTSATAPSSPSEGDGWFDTNTAKSYVYYDGVWVQLGALGTVDLNQIANVNVSSPANGESLVYDGTDWVNQNVSVDVYDVSTDSTGKFALPSGTTAERPLTPNAGDIRFNTETGRPEWYSADFSGWYEFHEFPSTTFNVEYLVIAGGGGGGFDASGGGGAGGYRSSVVGESSGGGASAESALTITGGLSYSITIGAGGSGAATVTRGASGSNSVFSNISSIGGAGGASASLSAIVGGSGGGAYYDNTGAFSSGTSEQGYSGGTGNSTATNEGFSGGGGGGAGGSGNASGQGNGGVGVESFITGSGIFRAGGGGAAKGSGFATGGLGGNGGGGNGAKRFTGVNSPGSPNTGGGGGGGDNQPTSVVGAAGGSGVVILKYPSSQNISPSIGLSYNTTTVGAYKVTEFTAGTGTVTFS